MPPLSNRNELKVLHELIRYCHKKLAEYPRTFEGDMDMLKLDDVTTNHRNALHVTLAEKTELTSLMEAAKEISDILFLTKEGFKKKVRDPDQIMQELSEIIE